MVRVSSYLLTEPGKVIRSAPCPSLPCPDPVLYSFSTAFIFDELCSFRAIQCGINRYEGKAGSSNAQELFNFANTYIPSDAPGTLKGGEYWTVVAFLLKEHGLYQGDKPLGRDNAYGIPLKR